VFARAGVTAAFSRFAGHGVSTVIGTDGYNMTCSANSTRVDDLEDHVRRADVANAPELMRR